MSTLSKLNIFCGTWNVNGKNVKEDLSPWLVPKGDLKPDVYALGFQEFDLTKESFVKIDEERVAAWDKAILAALAKVGDYVQIGRQQLVGMLVILYAKTELTEHFEELDSDMIGTGYFGLFGNKGGVGVRFRFQNDTFCIVNSHFNAHQHNVERRNNDYKSIVTRMLFSPQTAHGTNKPQTPMPLPEGFVASDDRAEESATEMPPINENRELKNGELGIFDHTHVIWIGDLNYRVDLTRDELMTGITNRNFSPLSMADQLRREIEKKNSVFIDFMEGPLNFLPSYKFDAGTDNYDSSRKMRLPAYCDRVLWKRSNGVNGNDAAIRALTYESHIELKISDHKPVSSILEVQLSQPFLVNEINNNNSNSNTNSNTINNSINSENGNDNGDNNNSNSSNSINHSQPSTPIKNSTQNSNSNSPNSNLNSTSTSHLNSNPSESNPSPNLSKTTSNLNNNNNSSPPKVGKLKTTSSSGNLGGTIQPKSYLLTTGYRFARKALKAPSTFVFLAVAVGIFAYYIGQNF